MKTILSRNNIIVSKNNIILPNNRHVRISENKTGGSIRKSITTTSFPIGITNTGSQPIKMMSKNFGNTISYGGSLNQNLARLNFSDKNKNKNVRLRM
jgi:hypothetical protein